MTHDTTNTNLLDYDRKGLRDLFEKIGLAGPEHRRIAEEDADAKAGCAGFRRMGIAHRTVLCHLPPAA